jgi:uncharacterized membrane protein
MKHQEFLQNLDQERILRAIKGAEANTTGEVRLCVTRKPEPDPMVAARRAFVALGMEQTRDRNGVLILISPGSQTFAVLGDQGIHGKAGEAFWEQITRELAAAFAAGQIEQGLESAIARIGDTLARHFPRQPGDTNELPDDIATV